MSSLTPLRRCALAGDQRYAKIRVVFRKRHFDDRDPPNRSHDQSNNRVHEYDVLVCAPKQGHDEPEYEANDPSQDGPTEDSSL